MFVGGYELHLYCDNAKAAPCINDQINKQALHDWDEFPHNIYGETWADVSKKAKARGWKIDKKNCMALCPKCVEAGFKLSNGEVKGT